MVILSEVTVEWESRAPDEPVSTVDVRADDREPPARLGRFVLIDVLGSGGMGIVYSAWDRELERRVAIKILHTDDRERSLREAQALARLAHANVVAVHDVGSIDGFDFIAMELVEGVSLREWLGQPRSWREILAAFRQAGRGLAAAHAAGLVHRDFKPENVLIANDGVVRVADFGLARAARAETEPAVAPTSSPQLLAGSLTRTGAHRGTPRYMAPEQRDGAPLDPSMDQYSFCVSLWESLFGRLPDEADVAGTGATRGRAPAWVRTVLRRGLSPSPARRYPSMDALLVALGRDSSKVRLGVGAVVVAATAAIAIIAWRAPSASPCAGGEQRLAGVWDAPAKRAIHAAFIASRRSYAEDTFARVATLLDGRAAAWVAMRDDTCEATEIRHEQSSALLDLRMECLDQRLGELRAMTALFARGGPEIVDKAVPATFRLGELAPCADTAALLAATPPPTDPAVRERVGVLRERLQQGTALDAAGRYKDALAVLAAAVADARTLGYPPVLGEALNRLGRTQIQMYDDKAAEQTLEEALPILAAARNDLGVTQAWIYLIASIGVGLSRPADALALRISAETALARASNDRQRAKLDFGLGQVLKQKGDYAEALAMQQQALRIQREVLDPGDPEIAITYNSLGVVLKQLGRYDEALVQYQAALALVIRAYGPEHPYIAGFLINIGNVYAFQARYHDAIESLERAREIEERTLGPEHPDVAEALLNLGNVHLELGNLDEARRDLVRSLAIRAQKLPPGHLLIASSAESLGVELLQAGHLAEGQTQLERAIAIYDDKLGPGNPRGARALIGLGDALVAQHEVAAATVAYARAEKLVLPGPPETETLVAAELLSSRAALAMQQHRSADALADARHALAIRERRLSADHPLIARALVGLGDALLATGHAPEAAAALDRAVHILEHHEASPIDLSAARSARARVAVPIAVEP